MGVRDMLAVTQFDNVAGEEVEDADVESVTEFV